MVPLRSLLFAMILLFPFCLQAQNEKKDSNPTERSKLLSTMTDGVVDISHDVATAVRHTGQKIHQEVKDFNAIDTLYISPNLYNLAFMLEHSTWYEHYQLGNNAGTKSQNLNFSPSLGTKLGVYFGWRWIFLGYTFDIEDLFGGNKNQTKKKEMSLNIYSSKFGIDLYYRKTGNDFKLRSINGFPQEFESLKNLHFDGLRSTINGLNAYWIFNHIKYSDYSLGFGYGYNWVFAKNWVSNLSLLPGIGYKKSRIDDNDFKGESWIKDINFDFITRAAIVYNNAKYFAGASLVLHTYDYRKPNLSVTNSFGTLRIYAGFNFWPKKEFKNIKE